MSKSQDKSISTPRGAWSVPEVAYYLNLSRATVYALWKSGLGPPRFKIKGRTLVSVDAAHRYLEQLQQPSLK